MTNGPKGSQEVPGWARHCRTFNRHQPHRCGKPEIGGHAQVRLHRKHTDVGTDKDSAGKKQLKRCQEGYAEEQLKRIQIIVRSHEKKKKYRNTCTGQWPQPISVFFIPGVDLGPCPGYDFSVSSFHDH
jgi:hypothetical protein